jgi:site-specific recombinase XerD
MVDGVAAFAEDLSRRFPQTSTAVHYVSDVRVFLRSVSRPLGEIQRTDIDQFIVWQQMLGRARGTINRRLVALRMLFEFLTDRTHDAGEAGMPNPVHPRRHYLRPTEPLPRDLADDQVQRLLAVISWPRDRALSC